MGKLLSMRRKYCLKLGLSPPARIGSPQQAQLTIELRTSDGSRRLPMVMRRKPMFGRKKKQAEQLPWYRRRNYKGSLTEAEKRQLDFFRMQEKHPAADYDRLPEEVKSYIGGLEMEVYDKKQEALVLPTLVGSGFGAYFLIRCIFGYDEGSLLRYAVSIAFLVLPWIWYQLTFNKNAEAFLPEHGASPTYEAILREWELDYISNKRMSERESARV